MVSMNAFKNDAFSTVSLTASINKLPYMPKMLGARGLFTPKPISTTVAMIEEKHGKLSLITSAARGDEPTVRSRPQRQARAFTVPHLPTTGKIMADDIQNVRAFGSETELETASEVMNEELENQKNDLEATREYHRTGAIQGIVYDGDGATVLYNWFQEFGITETDLPIDLTVAAAPIKEWVNQAIRSIQDNLGGSVFTGIECAVGNTAWDQFVTHPEVERAYERWIDGGFLREGGAPYSTFPFANVEFYNYRGQVGDVLFIPDNVFRFYPVGVRDVFLDVNAPADMMETVNTPGMPFYSAMEFTRFNKGVEVHSQSNTLMICTRPAALVKGSATVAVATASAASPNPDPRAKPAQMAPKQPTAQKPK